MDESAAQQPVAHLHARNVGGIDETNVVLAPGVNVLAGRNATNRTSFLQAVMAVVGSNRATLKGDAEEGSVTLELDDERYERTLRRVDGSVVFDGEPLLEDPELADLFAFLLEDNEARRAVERGDDLREIVVRPVDTAELHREIDRMEAEKREVDDELATLDDVSARLENRRQHVADLEDKRGELREELSGARDELADVEAQDGEESEALAELKAVRSDLEDVRFKLRTERESLESLREQRDELREEREELPAADVDAGDLDARIGELRERREELEADVGDLQAIVRFNEDMLEDADGVRAEIADEVGGGDDHERRSDGGTLTDALLADEEAEVCWTCGTSVERSRIEGTVERLQKLRDRKRTRKEELTAELEELTERKREAADVRDRRADVEESLETVESEIDERQSRVTDLEAERDDLAAEVEELEATVEAAGGHETAVDRAKRVNELEAELDRVEADLGDARETVADLEDRLAEREALEERRADIVSELADLRDRVDRVESEAVEAFNDHMATVLDRLGYDNVERIWIERTATTDRGGRRTVEQSEFDLHVVRSTDGTAYEDTVEHLSESEREVTGLVFALAGYLVHDVYETVPFLLLDSLEAIDSERIAALVDYVSEYTDFLVAALLEEDAQAVENVDNRVTDI